MTTRKLLRSYWVIREGKVRGEGRYWAGPYLWVSDRANAARLEHAVTVHTSRRCARVNVYAKPKWTAADERIAIAGWLREWPRTDLRDRLASAIERGEHMPKERR